MIMIDDKIIDFGALKELILKINETYATKEEFLASYKFGGSIDSPKPELLVKDNLGKVYNVMKSFTVDSDYFVDIKSDNPNLNMQQGGPQPEGTNVVVVEESRGVYKFDTFFGDPYKISTMTINILGNTNIISTKDLEEMVMGVFENGT